MIFHQITIVAIVALFGTIAHVGSSSLEPSYEDWLAHPEWREVKSQFEQVFFPANEISRIFEANRALPNNTQFRKELSTIKNVRTTAHKAIIDLNNVIAQIPQRHISNQLYFEVLRILVLQYGRLVKQIGRLIVSHLSGDFKFDSYVDTPKTIDDTIELVQVRYNHMMDSINEIDRLLKKDPASKDDPKTKKAVQQQIQFVNGQATLAKVEITKGFYEQFEKLQIEGKELQLMKKVHVEMYIDVLVATQEIVNKIKN